MPQYHITKSGGAAKCGARVRPCPRGAHYASAAEALLNAPAPLPTVLSHSAAEGRRLATASHVSILNEVNAAVFGRRDEAEEALWASSPFKPFWDVRVGKSRGTWGEHYLRRVLGNEGVAVQPPTSTENDGVFNGRKLEIKTNASSHTGGKLKVNWAQIRPDQDYSGLVGQVITPHEVVYFYLTKAEIRARIASGDIKKQHGGQQAEGGNTYVLSKRAPQWLLAHQRSLQQLVAELSDDR